MLQLLALLRLVVCAIPVSEFELLLAELALQPTLIHWLVLCPLCFQRTGHPARDRGELPARQRGAHHAFHGAPLLCHLPGLESDGGCFSVVCFLLCRLFSLLDAVGFCVALLLPTPPVRPRLHLIGILPFDPRLFSGANLGGRPDGRARLGRVQGQQGYASSPVPPPSPGAFRAYKHRTFSFIASSMCLLCGSFLTFQLTRCFVRLT